MASLARSHSKALKTGHTTPSIVRHASDSSSSDISLNMFAARDENSFIITDVSSDSSSFDGEELHSVYERCQVVVDHLDLHLPSSQGHSNPPPNVSDSDEDVNEDDLDLVFTKCQEMMEHIELNPSLSEDEQANGDDYLDGPSHMSLPPHRS